MRATSRSASGRRAPSAMRSLKPSRWPSSEPPQMPPNAGAVSSTPVACSQASGDRVRKVWRLQFQRKPRKLMAAAPMLAVQQPALSNEKWSQCRLMRSRL